MIGDDTSTPSIWRTVLTEFRLHATSASGATDATAALRRDVLQPSKSDRSATVRVALASAHAGTSNRLWMN